MDDAHDVFADSLSGGSSIPLRHAWITGGFVALMGTMIYTASDGLMWFDEHRGNVNRQEIEGSVEYQGVPLNRGTIRFVCQIVEHDMDFSDAEASIRNGVFRIPRHLGPMPGWYLARITPEPPPLVANPFSPPAVEVFDQWESPVIKASIASSVLVRVQARRRNRFDFRLH